jgi:hypothetical protein
MALHVWANIHGLTSLLVARPKLPWPELSSFVDEHLAICMKGTVHELQRVPVAAGGTRRPRK